MKTEIQKLIDFIESPKHAEDSEDRGYLSDGEVLDIVTDKLKSLSDKRDTVPIYLPTHALRTELEERGYYAGNMWCVEDVQTNWDASKEQAMEILDKVFMSEWMSMRIFEMINEYAIDMGLNEVE
jgi:hypothetical protein|tara:strand:- start:7632 stop:8006 length:375 start_codon:yes stop_codon:yes gene_type:complete